MVQNTTRKGWAVAAVVSLFAALLGASPAQAAVGDGLALKVTPANTTSVAYTTLVGQPFTVTPTLDNPADYQYLKYEITNVSGHTFSATVSAGTDTAVATNSTSKSKVVAASASSTVASKLTLTLNDTTSVSGPVTVSVRVFVESIIDGKYTAGEANSEQIITFVPYASAGATVTLDAISEASSGLTANITLPGINYDSVAKPVVRFFKNGTEDTTASAVATTSLVATSSLTVAAGSADTFSAEVYIANVKVATSNTVTSAARTIKFVTASAVAAANITAGTTTASARANSAFTVQVKTTTSSSGAVAVANVAGTYKVETSATLSSTVTLGVAGTTYTTKASLPTKGAFVTDANGIAKLDLLPTGFSTSDVITVSFTAQNYTSTIRISQDVATYTITNVDGDYAYAAKGGSVVLNYNVKDQWKVLSTAKQRLVLTDNGANFEFANAYPELTGGVASGTLVSKTTTASGTVTVSATLQKWDTASQNWVDVSATADADVKIVFSDTSLAFATKPTSQSASVSGRATVSGSVNIEGGSVSIVGAGLVWTDADGNTTSGAVTVRTAANGLFTVSATSKVAGKYPVTVTAGTYSQAIVITVDPVTADSGTVVKINSADTALPGTTVRIVFNVTDDNGNAVVFGSADTASLAVVVDGPGFWGTPATKTDADGNIYLNILLASADTGDIKVTATYTPSAGATKSVSASKTITVAAPAAAPVADAAKVNVGTFNGYVAVYAKGYNGSKLSWKIAGKWFSTTIAKDFAVYQRKTVAIGLDVNVDIYIDGVKELSKTVTTK